MLFDRWRIVTDQANEGLFSPLLRRKRVAAVVPFLNGRVLDVGCGSGALARFVDAGKYLGVERDQQSLARARSDFPQHVFQAAFPIPGKVLTRSCRWRLSSTLHSPRISWGNSPPC